MRYLYKMLSISILALLSLKGVAQEQKNGLTWYTDINKAYAQSKEVNKPVFAFFTGSDWCIWCHRLEANVFDKPDFKKWAQENVVLLDLDFPRNKRLPGEQERQNNSLMQFFKVQGFPTVWIFFMDKDKTSGRFNISPLGNLGYPDSRPGKEAEKFLEDANKVLKNKKA